MAPAGLSLEEEEEEGSTTPVWNKKQDQAGRDGCVKIFNFLVLHISTRYTVQSGVKLF
jgi:hypothetical protein